MTTVDLITALFYEVDEQGVTVQSVQIVTVSSSFKINILEGFL